MGKSVCDATAVCDQGHAIDALPFALPADLLHRLPHHPHFFCRADLSRVYHHSKQLSTLRYRYCFYKSKRGSDRAAPVRESELPRVRRHKRFAAWRWGVTRPKHVKSSHRRPQGNKSDRPWPVAFISFRAGDGARTRYGHPTNGTPFAGTLPDLLFDAPSAQVEAAGSPPAERKIGHPILDVLLQMERATGLEPATSTLARWRSTR